MSPRKFMLLAGEPSGDLLGAELVRALRRELGSPPDCFGAGGPELAAAGVDVQVDLTRHAVVGLVEVLKRYRPFKRIFDELVELAFTRRPDVIVCVDFSGFNRRFARKIRWEVGARGIRDWQPHIVQYVSPQVWASRPGRARAMARDFDLVLAIFPFEKDWYAERVPDLKVEFVGHPLLDRYGGALETAGGEISERNHPGDAGSPVVLLLPGSRPGELKRHLPVMLDAFRRIQAGSTAAQGLMVLSNEALCQQARAFPLPPGLTVQMGGLAEAMGRASVAIASTGTVTMECALFGLPTVAIYKTSWSTYQIGKRIVRVTHLAMPNILAKEALFPELIQGAATGGTVARAALELLQDSARREQIRGRSKEIMASLGGPGASARAARAIVSLMPLVD